VLREFLDLKNQNRYLSYTIPSAYIQRSGCEIAILLIAVDNVKCSWKSGSHFSIERENRDREKGAIMRSGNSTWVEWGEKKGTRTGQKIKTVLNLK
jgi:hypothetical protein